MEAGEFVATCAEFPSFSWLAGSQAEALQGLVALVCPSGPGATSRGDSVSHRARCHAGDVPVRSDTDRPALIRRRFRDFAAAYPSLPLYHAICAAAGEDDEVVRLLLEARPGQDRPVLLLAALHDLVLRLVEEAPDEPPAVSRWFASLTDPAQAPTADEWRDPGPWPEVRDLLLGHRDDLRAIVAGRTVQTNEVNRSTYVLALLALAAPGQPVALVEFGTSAGLLLTPDQYDVTIADASGAELAWGDRSSAVRLRAEDRLASLAGRGLRPPRIVSRIGVDLATVPPEDHDTLRWLQACLWPDMPERVVRFRAAVRQRQQLAHRDRPTLIEGDLTDPDAVRGALQRVLDPTVGDAHLVVVTSWTLTYVERSHRPRFAGALADFARTSGTRVSWCSAEPARAVPGLPPLARHAAGEGVTQLGLRRWQGGQELDPHTWGTADPHGRWLEVS